jgi:hypothetical protein
MENFGITMLNAVRGNREQYLGVLRRNGVMTNSSISNEDLTNKILKAMQKSEPFKKEAIVLTGIILSKSGSDSNFANYTGLQSAGFSQNFASLQPNFSTLPATTVTTTQKTSTKKDFEDTTVGKIVDNLFKTANIYLQGKELDVRKQEALTAGVIATSPTTKQPEKKDNTALYVALGVGGVAVLGLIIYLATKKK